MRNGREIRSRVTSIAAVAALAISLVNMGISQAGAANNAPETDKAYGILNEDGSAKAGISSIADIKNSMSTAGADFVVDTDEDGHAETVLSPTEIRNLLDVSYAADTRLEQSLNDLKTTTESTYLKKADAASTYAAKSSLSNYATTAALSNYYTKAQVDAKISGASASAGSTAFSTPAGIVDTTKLVNVTGAGLNTSSFPASKWVIWSGKYNASNLPTSNAAYVQPNNRWTKTNQSTGLLGVYNGWQSQYQSWTDYQGTEYYLYYASDRNSSSSKITTRSWDILRDSNFTLAPLVT